MLRPPGPLKNVIAALELTPTATAVPAAKPPPMREPLGQALRRPRAACGPWALQLGNRLALNLAPRPSQWSTPWSTKFPPAGTLENLASIVSVSGVPLGIGSLPGATLAVSL